MANYPCLLASDLHGNIAQYEHILRVVRERRIAIVFLAGDLFPKKGGRWSPDNTVRTIAAQKQFVREYFCDYLTRLQKYAHIYAIFGNDDFKSNYDFARTASTSVFIDNQVVRLPFEDVELYVAGYPYVSLTPFLQKDWEKWDEAPGVQEHKTYRLDGYDSVDGKHVPISFEGHADDRTTIAEDLQKLARKSNPKKTVYLIHEPPYDTPLDMVSRDNPFVESGHVHVGSKAVRSFIEREQPLLTMHGHIHETFEESGDFRWKSGNSVAITPSHEYAHSPLAYVVFDLPHLGVITRYVES